MKEAKLFNAKIERKDVIDILSTLESGNLATGQYVNELEEKFGAIVNKKHAISVSNLTMAILLILDNCGLKKGDEIVACSFSCMASNSPMAILGLNVSWIDWDRDSLTYSVDSFINAITPNTKAAILYHTAGYASDLSEIYAICKEKNIVLIEDCNNAHFSSIDNNYVGQQSDYAVYSLYPNRIVNSIDGAIITTNDVIQANNIKKARRFGIDYSTFRTANGEINPDADIPKVGYAATLDNISAQIALSSLNSFQSRIEKIIGNYNFLSSELTKIPQIKILKSSSNSRIVPWVFFISVNERDNVLSYLKENKVFSSIIHHLNHEYSCFTNVNTQIPNQIELSKNLIGLPCGWWLNEEELNNIVDTLKRYYNV